MSEPQPDSTVRALYDEGLGYARFHALCKGAFRRAAAGFQATPLAAGVAKVRSFDAGVAAEIRRRVGAEPGALFEPAFLDEYFGRLFAPATDALLSTYFKSEYAPLWAAAASHDTRAEGTTSFTWHCDGGPTRHLKILTYLDGTDEHGGDTLFLDRAATVVFERAGYVFCPIDRRLADLGPLATAIGIPYAPLAFTPAAGESLVFEPANVLHRGQAPTRGFRHVITVCLIPSPVPWREACRRLGLPRRDDAWIAPLGARG